jgi:hypothetical protein
MLGRANPDGYRWTGKDHTGVNASYGAIIAAPPQISLLSKFFASLGPMHLAADQRRAQEMRANCGKRGRKRDPDAPRHCDRSRARPKPSLAPFPECV